MSQIFLGDMENTFSFVTLDLEVKDSIKPISECPVSRCAVLIDLTTYIFLDVVLVTSYHRKLANQ